tara:strand:- start:2232 stop:3170 length:939 start_codon:yes stop_codon:yes gene_type:complete
MAYSLPGQDKLAGSDLALFAKIVTGQILTGFQTKRKFTDLVTTKTIPHGVGAKIKVVGDSDDGTLHSKGSSITGDSLYRSEKLINLTDTIQKTFHLAEEDISFSDVNEQMLHSQKISETLANRYDADIARAIIAAARDAVEVIPGMGAGTRMLSVASTADGIYQAIVAASVQMEEKGVTSPLYCFLAPAEFSLLRNDNRVISVDNGGASTGGISGNVMALDINGVTVMSYNKVFKKDESTNANLDAHLKFNNTTILGVAFSAEAVGVVNLESVKTRVDWLADKASWQLRGSYLNGVDVLNPACAIAFDSASV